MVHSSDEVCSDMNSSTTKVKKATSKNTLRESKGAVSRRIFSPVFKLQVLDSYRQDADCQGNQRATARKYGIHRRQIQKWLQMETNLRLSVQQSNITALNLSSSRQPDGNKEYGVGSISAVEVKKSPILINCSSDINNLNEVCNTSDSDEYVNVDEITDSEDDTSSCSSYEKNDRALDLTRATLSKRRFYTTDFKLHVLDAFKNDQTCAGSQRATARKFGIHRRQIHKWLKQENIIKSAQIFNNSCLDLSQNKRKIKENVSREEPRPKSFRSNDSNNIQESALCLVKNKIEPIELNDYYHIQVNPTSLNHSLNNSSSNYLNPDYPLCFYQPWNCCYHHISSMRNNFAAVPRKYSYSYSFDFKVSSYVDIPVQYGFGDTIPSKWIKENPLYMHESPSIHVLSSSYR